MTLAPRPGVNFGLFTCGNVVEDLADFNWLGSSDCVMKAWQNIKGWSNWSEKECIVDALKRSFGRSWYRAYPHAFQF